VNASLFWTVVKADALAMGISLALSIALGVGLALWKRGRRKPAPVVQGPRALILGGKELAPGHCPLCGRDWPLPGPEEKG